MGNCRFCRKPAGFLRDAHTYCKLRHDNAVEEVITLIENYASGEGDLHFLKNKILKNARIGLIRSQELKQIMAFAWEQTVEKSFEEGLLTESKEKSLTDFIEIFPNSQSQFYQLCAYDKIVKGAVLRNVLAGKLPEAVDCDANLPFNLQKSEKIIWLFTNTAYYEQKKRVQYVGGSQGTSLRISKGLSYRANTFKGERVETEETIHADTGLFAITNKHTYFNGNSRSFRIKFNKIVSFRHLSNGIGLHRDSVTAKPQLFITGDGWFTYNLIRNVAIL